ncbi:MAG: hypothetical protein V1867_00850 [Candidatus Falkowbacteria bacterium]
MTENAKTKATEDGLLVDHRCFICGKIAGRIRVGSKIAKGARLICADCQGKWDLLKKSAEMFRKEARESRNPFAGKNPFGDIFKDWGK